MKECAMARARRILLPIGIHLNADAVYMVQFEQTEGTVSVVSKAAKRFAPAPDANFDAGIGMPQTGRALTGADDSRYEEARQFIREKITSNGFRGAEAVLSLPAESLVIQHVRLPPIQPEELAATVMAELQGKLPFDPEEAEVRHIVAGTVSENNETKQDVIVLAALRNAIERQVSAVARLGLRVVGVGVEPCAMCYPYMFASAHAAPTPEGPPSLMIVFLGARATYVAILRGQEMTFVKGVELGIDNLLDPLARAKGITATEVAALRARWRESSTAVPEGVEAYNGIRFDLEHIVDEIQSCMRYYASLARGTHVDRVIFVGPEARDRALVRVIGAHVGVPCDVGSPLAIIADPPGQGEPEPEMAAAAGLSLFTAQ
jgi:type IV pilus assembly protein PilM